jgi:hypothetical protein
MGPAFAGTTASNFLKITSSHRILCQFPNVLGVEMATAEESACDEP